MRIAIGAPGNGALLKDALAERLAEDGRERTGAQRTIRSLYMRGPYRNFIEVAVYESV